MLFYGQAWGAEYGSLSRPETPDKSLRDRCVAAEPASGIRDVIVVIPTYDEAENIAGQGERHLLRGTQPGHAAKVGMKQDPTTGR